MEEVCWLVEMAAHLIADSGDGEVPLPPAALSSTLADQPSEAVLVQMGHLLLGVTGFCFEERLLHLASPRSHSLCHMPEACKPICLHCTVAQQKRWHFVCQFQAKYFGMVV